MMTFLAASLEAIRRGCLWLAIVATLALFGIVAFNIVARSLFDATGGSVNVMISGAIELSQYALMISIFAAIPAMLGTGLIRVDLLSKRLPLRLQHLADRLWLLLIAAFAGVLTTAFLDFALTACARGDQTQDLRLPLWPFYTVATVECAALMLLAFAGAVGVVSSPAEDHG